MDCVVCHFPGGDHYPECVVGKYAKNVHASHVLHKTLSEVRTDLTNLRSQIGHVSEDGIRDVLRTVLNHLIRTQESSIDLMEGR